MGPTHAEFKPFHILLILHTIGWIDPDTQWSIAGDWAAAVMTLTPRTSLNEGVVLLMKSSVIMFCHHAIVSVYELTVFQDHM